MRSSWGDAEDIGNPIGMQKPVFCIYTPENTKWTQTEWQQALNAALLQNKFLSGQQNSISEGNACENGVLKFQAIIMARYNNGRYTSIARSRIKKYVKDRSQRREVITETSLPTSSESKQDLNNNAPPSEKMQGITPHSEGVSSSKDLAVSTEQQSIEDVQQQNAHQKKYSAKCIIIPASILTSVGVACITVFALGVAGKF